MISKDKAKLVQMKTAPPPPPPCLPVVIYYRVNCSVSLVNNNFAVRMQKHSVLAAHQ